MIAVTLPSEKDDTLTLAKNQTTIAELTPQPYTYVTVDVSLGAD